MKLNIKADFEMGHYDIKEWAMVTLPAVAVTIVIVLCIIAQIP